MGRRGGGEREGGSPFYHSQFISCAGTFPTLENRLARVEKSIEQSICPAEVHPGSDWPLPLSHAPASLPLPLPHPCPYLHSDPRVLSDMRVGASERSSDMQGCQNGAAVRGRLQACGPRPVER